MLNIIYIFYKIKIKIKILFVFIFQTQEILKPKQRGTQSDRSWCFQQVKKIKIVHDSCQNQLLIRNSLPLIFFSSLSRLMMNSHYLN
jgi:hypothetical protein